MVWEEKAMSHNAQDRERAVQAITRRTMLEKRIKRTQQRMAVLQGEARQVLEASLLADQAALAEAVQMAEAVKAEVLEQFKAQWRQDEERIHRKAQEALRLKAEWQSRQFPPFPGGRVPPSPSQSLGLLVLLAAMAAIVGGVLLLNR